MRSFGEYPNEERESRLSQILQENVHPKYYLSARACLGILRRAEKRGKELPPLLKQTLEKQSVSKSEQDVMGGAKGYSYNATEQEHCQPSTTKRSCNSSGDDIAGTLDANYYKGCGLRQGIEREVVCIGNGQVDQAKESKIVGALNCMHDQQAIITYGLDRASFNQGENAQYDFKVEKELSQTGVARGWGGADPQVIDTLCARDFKGIGRHDQGKCIIQSIRRQR